MRSRRKPDIMPDSHDTSDQSATPLAPASDEAAHHLHRSLRRRRWRRRFFLLLGPIVVAIGAGYFYLSGGRYVGTDDAYLHSHKIQVSADISARVVAVLVHENEPV